MNRQSFLLLLTLFIIWMCVGIFPLRCYETDGQEIILGCDVMFREGWSLPPVYSYEYRMQPLITVLVVSLKHLMPFFTCEQIYCAVSALASLVFLFGCIALARLVTKSSLTLILIAAILLPEMYAIAMYANSAIPAAACFVWALVLLARERYWLSGLLMCVAVLFRLDIVVVYPVIFPLLIFVGKPRLKAFFISFVYGVVVVVSSLFFFWLMNADALNTYGDLQTWNGIITRAERILAIVGFYGLAYFLLLPLGLGVMAYKRQWKELFLVLLPIVLMHVVFSSFGNASKHFLYNAPFVIIAGVRALEWLLTLLSRRPILKWGTLLALVLYMTVSLRKWNVEMPWLFQNPLSEVGMVKPLYQTQHGNTAYLLGIGAGYQLVTNDEYMLLSGHIFYPWYIRTIKEMTGEWRQEQKAMIDRLPTSDILILEYGTYAPLSFTYLTEGSHFCQQPNMPDAYRFTLSDGKRDLYFWRIVLKSGVTSQEQVKEYIRSVTPHFRGQGAYLLSAANHNGYYYFMDQLVKQGELEKKAERLYEIRMK